MRTGTPSTKDWDLTREAFDKLLGYLGGDRNQAAAKYETLRRKLVSFFRWRDCPTPEDFADRTIDRVARRIAEGVDLHVTDPYVFVHGVALNVLREHWRSPERQVLSLDDWSPPEAMAPGPPPQTDETDEERKESRLECLDRCLGELAPESRTLLVRYHQHERRAKIAARRELAHQLSIPLNALRIRMYRLRLAVQGCVDDCVQRRAGR